MYYLSWHEVTPGRVLPLVSVGESLLLVLLVLLPTLPLALAVVLVHEVVAERLAVLLVAAASVAEALLPLMLLLVLMVVVVLLAERLLVAMLLLLHVVHLLLHVGRHLLEVELVHERRAGSASVVVLRVAMHLVGGQGRGAVAEHFLLQFLQSLDMRSLLLLLHHELLVRRHHVRRDRHAGLRRHPRHLHPHVHDRGVVERRPLLLLGELWRRREHPRGHVVLLLRGHRGLRRDGVDDGGVVRWPGHGLGHRGELLLLLLLLPPPADRRVHQPHALPHPLGQLALLLVLAYLALLQRLLLQGLPVGGVLLLERLQLQAAVVAEVEEVLALLHGRALLLGQLGQLLVRALLPHAGVAAEGVVVEGVVLAVAGGRGGAVRVQVVGGVQEDAPAAGGHGGEGRNSGFLKKQTEMFPVFFRNASCSCAAELLLLSAAWKKKCFQDCHQF